MRQNNTYLKLIALAIVLISQSVFLSMNAIATEHLNSNASISIKTNPIRYVGVDSAISGGVITNPNSEVIINAGVCVSKNPQPTVNDLKFDRQGSADSFTVEISGLQIQSAYYVRAFVETASGITYGPQRTFATDPAQLGQFYQGGFIVYIFKPGEPGYVNGEVHGFALASNYNTTTYSWLEGADTLVNALDSILGSGSINTQKIVDVVGAGNYAAKYCADLVLNGYDDWFLPSSDELILILNTRARSNVIGQYWSSTEVSKTQAISTTVTFKKRISTKSSKFRILPIRKF